MHRWKEVGVSYVAIFADQPERGVNPLRVSSLSSAQWDRAGFNARVAGYSLNRTADQFRGDPNPFAVARILA